MTVLKSYKSFRNRVCLLQVDGEELVAKAFQEEASFQKELQIYSLLEGKLPCARVIRAESQTLILSPLPGKNLVECLEEQERTGVPRWEIWEKLVAWLTDFQQLTGYTMPDGNLRNFLYDENTQLLYGLDFEECEEGSMDICAARVAAFIRLYKPENTPLKQEISQYVLGLFARSLHREVKELLLESARQEAMLIHRRRNRK